MSHQSYLPGREGVGQVQGLGGGQNGVQESDPVQVWRRLILLSFDPAVDRSRDDLASGAQADMFSSQSEDQWFSKEKLYKVRDINDKS